MGESQASPIQPIAAGTSRLCSRTCRVTRTARPTCRTVTITAPKAFQNVANAQRSKDAIDARYPARPKQHSGAAEVTLNRPDRTIANAVKGLAIVTRLNGP